MLFGEKVNNMQWIGVALAMVGLSLILIEPSKN
jgi:drug/metabolite transporter (DMT)-like permease